MLHSGKPIPERQIDSILCSNSIKCHSLHTLILENKHDTKKLYKLINNIISGKTQNPMPPNKTDEDLAKNYQPLPGQNRKNQIKTHPH